MKALCPKCASINVQTYGAAHKSGLVTSVSRSTSNSDYYKKIESVHISQIAKETAAPKRNPTGFEILVTIPFLIAILSGLLSLLSVCYLFFIANKNEQSGTISLIISSAVIFVIALLIGKVGAKVFKPHEEKLRVKNEQMIEDWSNSWICHSCDHRWKTN